MAALNSTWTPDLEGSTFNDHWPFTDMEREKEEEILEKVYLILRYVIRMHEISELSQTLFQELSDLEVF